MRIKSIVDEDFVNYKLPSMFIGTCFCDWKCALDGEFDTLLCQNSPLANENIISKSCEELYNRYVGNSITNAIVIGGLEPILQFEEVIDVIKWFRYKGCNDDFVIYTGYYKDEIIDKVNRLRNFENIILKFGRYIPNQEKHCDEVLGVYLASDNQYAEKIS